MTIPSFNEDFQRELALDWGIDPTPGAVRDAAWRRIHEATQYKVLSTQPQNGLSIYTEFLKSPELTQAMDINLEGDDLTRMEGVRTDVLSIMEEIQAGSTQLTPLDIQKLMGFSIEDLQFLRIGDVLDVEQFAQLQYDSALVTQLQIDNDAELEARIQRRIDQAESTSRFAQLASWVLPTGGQDMEVGPAQISAIRREETEKFINEKMGRADKNFPDEIAEWEENRKKEIQEQFFGDRAYEGIYGPRRGSNQTILPEAFGIILPETHYTYEDVSALLASETDENIRREGVPFLDAHWETRNDWDDEMQAQLDREKEELIWTLRTSEDPAAIFQRNGAVEAIFGGMGRLMTGLAQPVGWSAWAFDKVMPGHDFHGPLGVLTPYDMVQRWHDNDAADRLREYQEQTNVPDQERIERALLTSAEREWELMKHEDPQAFQEWVEMAGTETLAMGMFIGEVRDNEAWKTASEQMLQDENAMQEATLKALQETDFSFANSVMNVVAAYGRSIDKVSTSVMIGLTDQDVWDSLTAGEFRTAWTQIEERGSDIGWTPSGVFGLDGSAIGLTMDLGLGVVFDPITWLAGPTFKGATRGALAGTVDGAMRLAKSPTVRLLSRELVNIARSPQRSAGAFYMASSWLSGNARARLLAATGFTQDILPKLDPGKGWKGTRGAHEVSLSWVNRLVPDGVGVEDVADLADNIVTNNFQKPLVVTVARPSAGQRATVQLTDGIKRLRAAQQIGLDRVPVVLRIVDDTPLFLEAHLPKLREVAAGRHVTSTRKAHPTDQATQEQMLEWAEMFDGRMEFPVDELGRTLPEFQTYRRIDPDERSLLDQISDPNLPESTLFAMSEEFGRRRSVGSQRIAPERDIGKIVDKQGNTHTVNRAVQIDINGETNYFYYTVNQATDEVSAAMLSTADTITTGSKVKRSGIMEGIARVAHQNGDYVMLKTGKSASTSIEAQQWGQRVAEKMLKESDYAHSWQVLDDVIDNAELKEILGESNRGLGEVQTRPESLLPDEPLGLNLDQEIMDIVRDDIMTGTRPSDGARALLNSSLRDRVMALADKLPDPLSAGAHEVRKFFTQGNVTSYVDLHSPEAITDIIHQALKVWGSDMDRANYWIAKLLDYEMEAARRTRAWEYRAGLMEPLIKKVEALREQSPSLWDNEIAALETRLADDGIEGALDDMAVDRGATGRQTAEQQLTQARRNREQLTAARREAIDELEKLQSKIEAEVGRIPDHTELAEIITEMYEDFNRNHIVPRWSKEIKARPEILDADKGIVKWEELQKVSMWSRRHRNAAQAAPDTGFFPETLIEQAKELGIENPERLQRLYRQVNGIAETKMGLNLPMSTLDMIAASTFSGSKWIKWNQHMTMEAIRTGSLATLKVWMIDKVLRPATAATVSVDELLRIFHKGGKWAVDRYIQDRLLFANARMQNRLHGGSFFERQAVRKGSQYSPRVQERMRQLDEYTTKMREWERMWYDDFGIGWSDIFPDHPDYLDAAKQWTANMMQQSGFRAFLRGRDDFRDWFFSRDGAHIRNGTVMDIQNGRTYPLADWEKAYDGWSVMFDEIIMAESKAKGTYDEVVEMWRDTARQIDARGGKPVDMPEAVYQNLGAVRGVQKHTKHKFNPMRGTDAFFDRFFLDPVQYRRGFVADMVAQQEKARLHALYKSQGLRIVSDFEMENVLNLKGLQGLTGSGSGVRHLIHREALSQGIIPQSYIDELVQRHVNAEMDHMLYVAERGSRAGQAVRQIFPFGKPFADMAAFWGREMLRRPHYRSQFMEQNVVDKVANLGEHFGALRATSALANINPRTPALISRIAATDFTIDRGWDGGLFSDLESDARVGLIPGTESTDLSPLLFLPTEGENVFYSTIPGVGYFPMWMLDRVMAWQAGNPEEDPERYREVVDKWGQFIAGAHFGSPDMGLSAVQRVLGGGTLSTLFAGALDIDAAIGGGGHPYWNTAMGQPDREIDRSRVASSLLANPDEWTELFTLTSAEDINGFIHDLAREADRQAAIGNLVEQGSRWALPTQNKYSGDLDTIWDVWVDVALTDERLIGYNTDYDDDTATPEQRLDFARRVRSRFFDLSQASRDALIAANPSLAVNLVSSWEWTDEAESAGIAEGIPYRTDGSPEGLDRHWLYIREGYIRPLAPEERIRRVIGLVLNSQESTAKGVYTSVAVNWNEFQWENMMSDRDRAIVEMLYNDHTDEWTKVGIESPQELWRSWGTYEAQAEELFAEAQGIPAVRGVSRKKDDITPFDMIRTELIKIDTKPWSETWVGTDLEGGPSDRMATLPIGEFAEFLYDDIVREQADAAGINLEAVLTGNDLWLAAQQRVVEIPRTLQLQVDPAYQSYVGSRTAIGRAVDDNLRSIKDDRRFAEDYRKEVDNFIEFEKNMDDRYREAPLGIPPSEKLRVQQEFMKLMLGAEGTTLIDFEQLWTLGFERKYGTLGWTPDDPATPYTEDGQTAPGAWQPYILDIVDGDSIKVRKSPHGETHEIRLLGVRARDYGIDDEGAREDKDRLWDALQQAIENDDMIWLVREPDKYGNVDMFGRELAWLWIGDTPFYFPEEMLPDRDPTGPDFVDPFGGDQ